MVNKRVGQTELNDADLQCVIGNEFSHRAACAALHTRLFDRHQRVMRQRDFTKQRLVQRFDETHVDNRCVEFFADDERRMQH